MTDEQKQTGEASSEPEQGDAFGRFLNDARKALTEFATDVQKAARAGVGKAQEALEATRSVGTAGERADDALELALAGFIGNMRAHWRIATKHEELDPNNDDAARAFVADHLEPLRADNRGRQWIEQHRDELLAMLRGGPAPTIDLSPPKTEPEPAPEGDAQSPSA